MGSVKKSEIRRFQRILIANRGEISCRIQRTCHRLGIETVAIGSQIDQDLMHMQMADKAVVMGSSDCYLDQDTLIEIALQNNAQGIHPGYGFLSESADFAQKVGEAGLIFIGPTPEAIRAMGSKAQAKEIAKAVNLPIIPGYVGQQDLNAKAEKIGFPLLIKATYGGGGKGMRRVNDISEFEGALAACQREAKAAFGNEQVMLEKYIACPRHVEVQVLGDSFGKCIVLSDRDCSLQRRHQKIIEEAPAPDLSSNLRSNLHDAAILIAQAVSYEGLGTVEFLVTPTDEYYFLEMNTRLQVEHPVTEMILGLDLVEWQLRVAGGEPLLLEQTDQKPNGHAIEARLYAEDADQDFLPSTGVLTQLDFPAIHDCRVDTGFQEGDEVTIYYDPMIAKIISWGQDRNAALAGLRNALLQTKVTGIKSNHNFLQSLLSLPDIQKRPGDIEFVDRFVEQRASASLAPVEAYLLTVLWMHYQTTLDTNASPWIQKGGWRLNAPDLQFFYFTDGVLISLFYTKDRVELRFGEIDYQAVRVTSSSENVVKATINGEVFEGKITPLGEEYHIDLGTTQHILRQDEVIFEAEAKASGPVHLTSPMPGRVVSVMVALNEPVEAGQPLLILEAMKMEHTIRAPHTGIVHELPFSPGDFCEEGVELIRLREEA